MGRPPLEKKQRQLAVALPDDVRKRLEAAAAKVLPTGHSLAEEIRRSSSSSQLSTRETSAMTPTRELATPTVSPDRRRNKRARSRSFGLALAMRTRTKRLPLRPSHAWLAKWAQAKACVRALCALGRLILFGATTIRPRSADRSRGTISNAYKVGDDGKKSTRQNS